MPIRTRTLVAVLMAALTLAACSGPEPEVRARTATFEVRLDDYLLRPQNLRVPKGERLTVKVTNHGRLGHTFRIRGTTRNVLAITTIKPGESRTRSFRLAPGTYRMYCVLSNHEELGMHATLRVG